MKVFDLSMERSSLSLYHVEAHSSDEQHDLVDFYQVSIPLVGLPHIEHNGQVRCLDTGCVP